MARNAKNNNRDKKPSFWNRESRLQISLFGAQAPHIVVPEQAPEPRALAHPPRVAVVLGGGGARGFAHVGVLNVLQKAGIPIDLVVGTSVGSLIGAIYCDDYHRDDMKQEVKMIKPRDVLDLGIFRLGKGVFTGNALQQYVHKTLSAKDFSELKTKLVVTAVDVGSSEIIALESGPIAPAINASCALPPFFHAVRLYGYTLVDGGVIDPVPVAVARQYNPQMIIAVDVSPEITLRWPSNLLSRFIRSYNMTIARLGHVHAALSDIVITPEVGDTDLFDFTNRIRLYHKGIEAAEANLKKIKQLTNELTNNPTSDDRQTNS